MTKKTMDPGFMQRMARLEQALHNFMREEPGNVTPLYKARAALWRWHCEQVERAVREAFREGYHTAADSAWCEKQLRRDRVRAEAHEALAEEYFWNASPLACREHPTAEPEEARNE